MAWERVSWWQDTTLPWSAPARLHYTAVALAGLAFLAVAWEYNFLTLPGV